MLYQLIMFIVFADTVNQEIFVSNNKSHICVIKNSRLGHDLPISVNDRVIYIVE